MGEFSTGMSRERFTQWIPERRLAFVVDAQPPMMEEMSPYRRVHAPHVTGYFETKHTGFILDPLPGGKTRLTAQSSHVLRLDPSLYWSPMARWAITQNVGRVLASIKTRAERRRGTSSGLSACPANGIKRCHRAGRPSRTFSGSAAGGLACRDGDDWRIEGLYGVSGSNAGDYRMAAAADPRLAALVESVIVGEPLDGTREAAARQSGWR